MKMSLRQGFVLLSATSVLVSVVAAAQTPWIVTVAPTMDPLPAGVCTAVKFSVTDATGAVPRNPDGSRILQSDFDLTVTASNPASVAGMYSGSNNWAACVCQGAPPGSVATITATYPSQALAQSMRVGRVPAKASTTFVTAKPMGPINPPGCQSASLRAIAETRPLSVSISPITTSVIAKVPAVIAPSAPAVVAPSPPLSSASGSPTTSAISPAPISATATKVPLAAPSPTGSGVSSPTGSGVNSPTASGVISPTVGGVALPTASGVSSPTVAATGVKIPLAAPPAPPAQPATSATSGAAGASAPDLTNPSGFTAVQTGPAKVLLSWEPVRYTSYYVLFGPGLPQGGQRINGPIAPLTSGQSSAVATGGVSIDATAYNVPPGNQEWAVGSYYDPGGVSTAAADFSRVALKVVLTEPINPPDLSATQIATGVIRLSWEPVNGVSYYRLYGAGLPAGGVKVDQPDVVSSSTATSQAISYSATSVPAGLRVWRVGSFLDPGAVSTDSSTFPKATLNVAAQVPGNPVGFTAIQIRPGAVRLSWKLMYGATYYMLSGDGLQPGGLKIVPPSSYLSATNSPPPDSVTWAVTDLPAGMRSWKVGSFRDPGAISADPAAFPTVTLNVTNPVVVNPSDFIGVPLAPGQVRFSWRPVDGASYYLLLGTGLPQAGVRVGSVSGLSGTPGSIQSVEHTATGLPPGNGVWQVGSYFEPGPYMTARADFPEIIVDVNPPTNPSAFTAVQTGLGAVQFSWQPVTGASYYVLQGTGLPQGGVRVDPGTSGVSGTTATLSRVGFIATGVPSGDQSWQVGSFFAGDFSTAAAAFTNVTINVKPPLNPSGFTALQTNPGMVRLRWRPVKNASYYVLLGPGLPQGGAKVGLATIGGTPSLTPLGSEVVETVEEVEFTAIGVPSGSQEWAVASYYEPGPISTPAAEFPRTTLNVLLPENPEGFAAIQTGSGQVKLSWQAVRGASYYMLTGTGLPPGGVKVQPAVVAGSTALGGILADLEFTANGISAGRGRWQVGSYFTPGPVSTPVAEFSTTTLTVTLQTP